MSKIPDFAALNPGYLLKRPYLLAGRIWEIGMKRVFSMEEIPWKNLKDLPGARGFEYKVISDGTYSSAFNSELVRLEPGDHSVPHVETWSHLLYFVTGTGDITIKDETTPVSPGTVALVKAGERHSLRNLGGDDMIILAVYDPPRTRAD